MSIRDKHWSFSRYVNAEDSTTVFFHVCIPTADVNLDGDDGLYYTAVAQVLASILQATSIPDSTVV